ncbi:MAG TPA: T9SS type A sorting domain-containing protein [Flavobacteriales bacterium]|nr:T9SS type A sorting domain-containing protein [Flavobacteriales bacterium]HIN42221.1 T9SS type A sorting domain-containing protein [Flavobacteriales bacterium]HIO15970.1 T9SS type A sorting domain-containing protein [Flavobacteriales bacterium]HIO58701.1 T9SS type A sorting domain-containing protein [Flavobacteriales bacterium]
MNKFYLLIVAFALTSTAFGQCVADFDFGDVGFGVSPDPQQGENFDSGVVNQPYIDILHILIPAFAADVDPTYPPTLPIDSIELISVLLTDTVTLLQYSPVELGLEVVCNNNGDSPSPCMFMGAAQYCASLQGTPNTAGVFIIDLHVIAWLTIFEPFSTPTVFSNFMLNIQCDLIESIAVVDADSDLGTNGSIDVTLGADVVATSFSWTDADGNVVGTEEDLTDVGPGVYDLTITTADCTSHFNGNVVVDAAITCALVAEYVIVDEVSETLGSIDVTVTGSNGVATFVWTDADGLTVGTGEDLTDVSTGTYTLTITDEDGCTLELTDLFVDFVIKVENLNASTDWTVSPNPTNSSFAINSNDLIDAQISVLDVSGRVVFTEVFTQNQIWNVSSWNEGVYFIQIAGKYGTTTRRLIVQH